MNFSPRIVDHVVKQIPIYIYIFIILFIYLFLN